jgi:hypothetical protein
MGGKECRKEFFLRDMVNAKPHLILDLRAIYLLQGTKTAYIQRLKNVRCMGRHTQSQNVVLKAEISEFRC